MKTVIGIDQSYTDTGIAVAADGVIQAAISLPLSSLSSDTQKRLELRTKLISCIKNCIKHDSIPEVYFEQVRINRGQTTFNYIKHAGAMEATIIDTCAEYDVNLYSVASNAWKSAILGTRDRVPNILGIPPEKYLTYEYTSLHGYNKFTLYKASKQSRYYVERDADGFPYKYNDNIGDAICICLYGCLDSDKQKRTKLV